MKTKLSLYRAIDRADQQLFCCFNACQCKQQVGLFFSKFQQFIRRSLIKTTKATQTKYFEGARTGQQTKQTK